MNRRTLQSKMALSLAALSLATARPILRGSSSGPTCRSLAMWVITFPRIELHSEGCNCSAIDWRKIHGELSETTHSFRKGILVKSDWELPWLCAPRRGATWRWARARRTSLASLSDRLTAWLTRPTGAPFNHWLLIPPLYPLCSNQFNHCTTMAEHDNWSKHGQT